MMVILALDLGTQMGWALRQASGVTSGSVSFAVNKRAGFGVRFLNFRRWLVGMLKKYHVDMVVFEAVYNHAGTYAAHVYGGFAAQLAAICEEQHVPYRGFGVKTIKKFIAGNGNASKQDVINAVQTRGYGPMAEDRPLDDNEADAIALLLLAENIFVKENKNMYNDNFVTNTNRYSASFGTTDGEVEIHIIKNNANDFEVQTGPFKYSQVTGNITPRLR
jgi:Holliday junction resolvasome RuvABC endonuclease subunit